MAKNVKKIGRDFGQLSTLIANISGMDRHNANLKSALSTTTPPLLGENSLVNFNVVPAYRPSGLFQETIVRPLCSAAA